MRAVSHVFWIPTIGPSPRSEGNTHSARRGSSDNNLRAGAARGVTFFPVFESGSHKQEWSKSTHAHFRSVISRRRHPVSINMRMTLAAVLFIIAQSSSIAMPSARADTSRSDRKRSRLSMA